MALLATAALSAARSPCFWTFWLRPAGHCLLYLWPQRPPCFGRQDIRSCPEHSSFGPVWPPRTAVSRLWPL